MVRREDWRGLLFRAEAAKRDQAGEDACTDQTVGARFGHGGVGDGECRFIEAQRVAGGKVVEAERPRAGHERLAVKRLERIDGLKGADLDLVEIDVHHVRGGIVEEDRAAEEAARRPVPRSAVESG